MEQHGTRPAASWVMGHSARWHTAEGAAILAEDGVAEGRRRDASLGRAVGLGALKDPTGLGIILWVLDVLIRIAWRTFGRQDCSPLSWPSCGSASSARRRRSRRRRGG